MTFLRLALAVVLAGSMSVLTAAPALAHTELKSSDPVDGASLAAAPSTVTLTFEEAVTLPANPISITGPDGAAWTVGTPRIDGASVSAPVQATGPAGQYRLTYAVIADDGDTVKGAVTFNLTAPVTPSAAAAPTGAVIEAPAAAPTTAPTTAPVDSASGSDTASSSAWAWVAVVVVVLGVGAALAGVVRRRRAGAGRE